jgi:hypothetical protein
MTTRAHKRFTPSQATLLRNWIEALRSGRYKQGTGCLLRLLRHGSFNKYAYCCLGVACDVHSAIVGGYWDDGDGESPTHIGFVIDPDRNADGEQDTLPTDVQSRFGLRDVEVDELIRLNDAGVSFNTIANQLEHCLTTGRWI